VKQDPFLAALSSDVFDEQPADLETFLYDERYLGKANSGVRLSEIQLEIVRRGSQIYKLETLVDLYGFEKGKKMFGETTRNFLLMLGKGSGKDFTSRITFCYIIHKLLCLKDPSAYYGKPSGDNIDLVNLALNADQAYRVFFNPLKKLIEKSPWFREHTEDIHVKDIQFKKEIYMYSLHSSYEAAEGLNIFAAALDEIDGFEQEGAAEAIFEALSHTVTSRFHQFGKLLCLSFPRSKDGWIMTEYDRLVIKETARFSHVYKLNYDLPDGTEGNEFTVHWDEDTVVGYKEDGWFAMKAPTFRVNPTTKIENYRDAFWRDLQNNTQETLLRVCANPPDHKDSTFFKNQDLIKEAFDEENGWNQATESVIVKGDPDKEYFIHVDLSKVSDRTVVAMGHVSHWQQISIGGSLEQDAKPYIVIDLYRVWEPTHANPVDNVEVTDFILLLAKNFNVVKTTFDRWGSIDIMKYLEDRGVENERQSLVRSHYEEFKYAVQDQRLKGPYDKRFEKELRNLIITKTGKVDHPDGKEHYNDISEAVCGVINNCVNDALEELDVKIITVDSIKKEKLQLRNDHDNLKVQKQEVDENLRGFLDGMRVI
jgi:hypothetical protein